jgi:adenylosuccinate synthase
MTFARNSDCTVVVGAQWGNEGKGKLVHRLCETADVCARFNGGANNVHTVFVDGSGRISMGRGSSGDASREVVLRLFPLGVLHKNCQVVFGNGMMIHLPTLLDEIRMIQETFDPNVLDRIHISTRAHVVFDFHQQADNLFDDLRENKLGTTQKGIGPAYSTKTIRNGIRFGDFCSDRGIVKEKVGELLQYFSKYTEFAQKFPTSNLDEIVDREISLFSKISHRVVDTVAVMNQFITSHKKIICEGSNSIMSDIDFGTYPFVTSSNTTPGSAAIGLGIPPTKISNVIAVCKAYTTRAQHAFPGTIDASIADQIRRQGNEFGTSNGAPRRVGWLDLVQVKYSGLISGFDSILLTKLEALTGIEKIGIVTSYDHLDVEQFGYPCTEEEFKRIEKTTVEYFDGWTESIEGVDSFEKLPNSVKQFIGKIEHVLRVPVKFVQIGRNIIERD